MDLPVERILRPRDLDDAVALLAADPGARPLAGGTDLVVQLRDGRRRAETLVDLTRLPLKGIEADADGSLRIGAATSMAAIARDPLVRRGWPALAESAGLVGAWPIQCRATLGGNLANASPAADTVPALLVADAVVEIASPTGHRRVAVVELFRGPGQTVLEPGDLLVAVILPPPPSGRVIERFTKVGPRPEQIIAVVSLAARAAVDANGVLHGVRLALGAVAPTPVRARSAEAALEGRRLDETAARAAQEVLQRDIAPIDDVRAPASYRRMTAAVLLDRFLAEVGRV